MFFLRCANVLIDACGTLDKDTANQFSCRLDKRLCSYSHVYVFPSYSANKWPISAVFFMWPRIELLHKCSEFGEYISFHLKVIGYKGPRPFQTFGVPLWLFKSKFQFDNYWYSFSRESFCTGLVPIGPKPRTSLQKVYFSTHPKYLKILWLISLGFMSDFVLLIALAPPSGRLGRALVRL